MCLDFNKTSTFKDALLAAVQQHPELNRSKFQIAHRASFRGERLLTISSHFRRVALDEVRHRQMCASTRATCVQLFPVIMVCSLLVFSLLCNYCCSGTCDSKRLSASQVIDKSSGKKVLLIGSDKLKSLSSPTGIASYTASLSMMQRARERPSGRRLHTPGARAELIIIMCDTMRGTPW